MKRKLSTELAYVFGIVFVALGVMLMEKADFGVSMVVAPAYLLYRWLSPSWSFFTFGMNGRRAGWGAEGSPDGDNDEWTDMYEGIAVAD